MSTSLLQRPVPAFPKGVTHMGSGIAWTLTPVGDSKLFQCHSPQGNTCTYSFSQLPERALGKRTGLGVRREDSSVGHCEGEEISPQCRKKSKSRAGTAHSRALGWQMLARSSSMRWGDKIGSEIPEHSGQKAPQRPPFLILHVRTQRPRNPGPGPQGESSLCATSVPVRSESEGHII